MLDQLKVSGQLGVQHEVVRVASPAGTMCVPAVQAQLVAYRQLIPSAFSLDLKVQLAERNG